MLCTNVTFIILYFKAIFFFTIKQYTLAKCFYYKKICVQLSFFFFSGIF